MKTRSYAVSRPQYSLCVLCAAAAIAGGLCAFPATAAVSGRDAAGTKTGPHHKPGTPLRAKEYFRSTWGIDDLVVRQTASGNLIRFSYRVIKPALAEPIGSERAAAYMVGQRSRAVLQVPVMDKVGKLRQTGKQEAGKEYWMVFSNKGNPVKSGDRVDVIIGSFHASGLLVE